MMTYFCPNCWQTVAARDKTCPHCGYFLEEFSNLDYQQKLLDALNHPIPERRMIAAQILGNLNVREAIPIFKQILAREDETYYFLRAILLAVAKITHPDRIEILQNATHHPSRLVSSFAVYLLEKISNNETIETWDHFCS